MPIMACAFVLCCEAPKTSADGFTERHGPDKEHVQSAVGGLETFVYFNARCHAVSTNLGKGDDPTRICLLLGAPATSLSCESINVTTTFCCM